MPRIIDVYDPPNISPECSDKLAELRSIIYGIGVNSTDRFWVLMSATRLLTGRDWWACFIHGWPSCDASFRDHALREEVLERMQAETGRPYAGDGLTLYRGCGRDFLNGFSWTTDKDVAIRFAAGQQGYQQS